MQEPRLEERHRDRDRQGQDADAEEEPEALGEHPSRGGERLAPGAAAREAERDGGPPGRPGQRPDDQPEQHGERGERGQRVLEAPAQPVRARCDGAAEEVRRRRPERTPAGHRDAPVAPARGTSGSAPSTAPSGSARSGR